MNRPKATLLLRFADAAAADRALKALAADDDAYVQTQREGDTLVIDAECDDLRSLLRAVDDVLANAAVSEDLIKSPDLEE